MFAPIFFLISLYDPARRANLRKKSSPATLLVGLSLPAFCLTHAEIVTWGKPLLFVATNVTGVVLISALAFFRDKRDAKHQEILKNL
jgi:hypothetical protein